MDSLYKSLTKAAWIVLMVAVVMATACDEGEIEEALEFMNITGQVTDQRGDPVEGAEVSLYLLSENLDTTQSVQMDAGESPIALLDRAALLGRSAAETVTTDADGNYEFTEQRPDYYIVTGDRDQYSVAVLGMDDDGTLNEASAVAPADLNNPTHITGQNMVLAGGPIQEDEAQEPEPQPEPAEPECTENEECEDQPAVCEEGSCVAVACHTDDDCTEGGEDTPFGNCVDDEGTPRCQYVTCKDSDDCTDGNHGECLDNSCLYTECFPDSEDEDCPSTDAEVGICDADTFRCVYEECFADADCEDENEVCLRNECRDEDACDMPEDCTEDAAFSDCVENRCEYWDCEEDEDCDGVAICIGSTGSCQDVECTDAEEHCTEGNHPECFDNECSYTECIAEADEVPAEDCEVVDEKIGFCFDHSCTYVDCFENDDCEDANCIHNECVAATPANVVEEPDDPGQWESFRITTADGDLIADASDGMVEVADADVPDVGFVQIEGEYSDPSAQEAVLRVQIGVPGCDNQDPYLREVPVRLTGGRIKSEDGDFHKYVNTGGFMGFQLDNPEGADPSYSIRLGDMDCETSLPNHELTLVLTWDSPTGDMDLHVWDDGNGHAYWANQEEDFGWLDVDIRHGYGPETFRSTNAPGEGGYYDVRLHHWAGPPNMPCTVQAIYVDDDGRVHTEVYEVTLGGPGDWVDIATFDFR